jgi:sterol O-acyltransferase
MSSAVSQNESATLRPRAVPIQHGKSDVALPLPVDKLAQDTR